MAANTVPVECVVEYRTLTAFAEASATRQPLHTVRINAAIAIGTHPAVMARPVGRTRNMNHPWQQSAQHAVRSLGCPSALHRRWPGALFTRAATAGGYLPSAQESSAGSPAAATKSPPSAGPTARPTLYVRLPSAIACPNSFGGTISGWDGLPGWCVQAPPRPSART